MLQASPLASTSGYGLSRLRSSRITDGADRSIAVGTTGWATLNIWLINWRPTHQDDLERIAAHSCHPMIRR